MYKYITIILLLNLLRFTTSAVNAGNYYLSASGDDSNLGSLDSPWKNLNRLNQQKLLPGDSVFFHCGDIFKGTILVNSSGKQNAPIVFTSYGQGKKPVISGAININSWEEKEDCYVAKTEKKVRALYVNHALQTVARHPNHSFLYIDHGIGHEGFIDSTLDQQDGYWNGATVRIRTINWVYETRIIGEYVKNKILLKKHPRYRVERGYEYRFDQAQHNTMYPLKEGYGYFLENKMELLDTLNEWFYSEDENSLYLKIHDPYNKRVQASVFPHGVIIHKDNGHLEFRNLHFEKYYSAAFYAMDAVHDIQFEKNMIKDIDGFGIKLDSGAFRVNIADNIFTDLTGRGIYAMECSYSGITGNTLKNIGLVRGYGCSGVNGASGIVIANIETKIQVPPFACHNQISGNNIDSCGYAGIRMDGHNSICEKNIVRNTMLTLNDGASIYCFARQPEVTFNNIIRNNIVVNSKGDNKGTPGNKYIAKGIYLDNNTHNIKVEKNTVTNCTSGGILVNDHSHHNKILSNNLYNNNSGISFAEWANVGKCSDNIIEDNVVFCKNKNQIAVQLINHIHHTMDPGKFSKNIYINFKEKFYFEKLTVHDHKKEILRMDFEGWQNITGNDTDGYDFGIDKRDKYHDEGIIILNTSRDVKEYQFKKNGVFDPRENKIREQFKIDPFSSVILLNTKN